MKRAAEDGALRPSRGRGKGVARGKGKGRARGKGAGRGKGSSNGAPGEGSSMPRRPPVAVRRALGVRQQVEYVHQLCTQPNTPFRLRPSMLLELHRRGLQGLQDGAGVYRSRGVRIRGRDEVRLPQHHQVPALIEELCDELNGQLCSPIIDRLTLAAWGLFRLCDIHPFLDGNGRTARALAYLLFTLTEANRGAAAEADRGAAAEADSCPLPQLVTSERSVYLGAFHTAKANATISDLSLQSVMQDDTGGAVALREAVQPFRLLLARAFVLQTALSAPEAVEAVIATIEAASASAVASVLPTGVAAEGAAEMAQQQQQQVYDSLACPVCMETLSEPVTLAGCGHSFCRR